MVLKGRVSYDSPLISNGVEVAEITEDNNFKVVYDPSHPDANEDGFVKMPNINIVTEMVDMMMASRAYEANVASIEAAKSMISSALKIGG
jgi:flagellar basal-body rod protein FlgC